MIFSSLTLDVFLIKVVKLVGRAQQLFSQHAIHHATRLPLPHGTAIVDASTIAKINENFILQLFFL
jgi:hypothetical protein